MEDIKTTERPTNPAPAARPRLLLVDDDRLVLATLADGLRDEGYEVSVAASGEEAEELCKSESFDLAILDVRMPGMDGLELARRMRANGAPPFLCLSAYGDTDKVKAATGSGALGYLVKPIDIPQLVPSIEAALIRGDEIRRLRDSEVRLQQALVIEQKTRMAVGILMERDGLDRQAAFEALRQHARSSRRKIAECAEEIVSAVDTLNQIPRRGPDSRHH
jgi:AmiR/NasT family two-component response regulator